MFNRPTRNNLLLYILYATILFDAILNIDYFLRSKEREAILPIPGGFITTIAVSLNYMIVLLGMFIQTLQNCHINTGPLSRGICQRLLESHRHQFYTALENLPLLSVWQIDADKNAKFIGSLKEQKGFICSLTRKTFVDPVVSLSTGRSYEKSALREHQQKNGDRCSITGNDLGTIVDNHALRKLIAEIPDHLKHQNILTGGYRIICQFFIRLARALHININEDYFLPKYVDNMHEIHDAISREKYMNPVVIADGHSHEERAIVEWFEAHNTSPSTGLPLPHKHYVENIDLKLAVESIESILQSEEIVDRAIETTKAIAQPHIDELIQITRTTLGH